MLQLTSTVIRISCSETKTRPTSHCIETKTKSKTTMEKTGTPKTSAIQWLTTVIFHPFCKVVTSRGASGVETSLKWGNWLFCMESYHQQGCRTCKLNIVSSNNSIWERVLF